MRLALVILAACGSPAETPFDAGSSHPGFPDEGDFPPPIPPDAVACTNFCDQLCVDTRIDPLNCGNCGVTCTGAASECVDSACVVPGATRWMQSIAGQVNAVTLDENGNVYATGAFTGTLDLGSGVTLTSGGDSDAFVAEWSPSGTPMWAKRFGGTATDRGTALLYASGNLFVGVEYTGTALLGYPSRGGTDVLAVRLLPDGTQFSVDQFGGPGDDTIRGFAFNGINPTLALCGSFGAGTFQTPSGVLISQAISTGYVASLSIGGGSGVERSLGDTTAGHHSACTGVGVDTVGNIDVTGTFDGAATFAGNAITVPTPTAFIAQYQPGGLARWVHAFTGGTSSVTALALDAGGSPTVVGNFSGSVDFGSGALTASTASDGYLASFSRNGVPALSRRYGDTVAFTAIAFDAADVLATGHASTGPDFGTGGDDMFVTRLGGTAVVSAKRYGAGAGTSIAVAPSGAFVVAGTASGTGLLLEQNP